MLVKIEIKLNNTNEVILNIKYKMIQTSEYKYIEYKDDEVVITHDVLEEYEEVNDVTTELRTGINIRYYSLVKDKKKKGEFKKLFRLGGNIIKIDPDFKYVVLTNGKLSWCVQLDNTIIYKKMSIKDIKDFYENELDVKDDIIKRKDNKIGKLK